MKVGKKVSSGNKKLKREVEKLEDKKVKLLEKQAKVEKKLEKLSEKEKEVMLKINKKTAEKEVKKVEASHDIKPIKKRGRKPKVKKG
jgi:predicted  nucleic acid-binding Zn-ribbon protein